MRWPWQKPPLTDEERAAFATIRFCPHCGGYHWPIATPPAVGGYQPASFVVPTACPRVESMAFGGDGQLVTSVTYLAKWDSSRVFWLEDAYQQVKEPDEPA
jgi:hypothetical protein